MRSILLALFFLFQIATTAQTSVNTSELIESCLNHPTVLPILTPVETDDSGEFIPLVSEISLRGKLEITAGGTPVVISEIKELFFYGIEDYVKVLEFSETEKTVTFDFLIKDTYRCTYDKKKSNC